MRKIFYALAAGALATAGLSSCSEKIDVAAPYKQYTVVAGLLNASDTAHYIRIQKAFLDGSKSAVDMAKNVDSNFYAQLDVKVKVFNNSGSQLGTITPTRVDLNAEGYTKDDGTFFTSPSYAYKFTDVLNPNNIYRLVITHADGSVDSSETSIITKDISANGIYIVQNIELVTYQPDFSDTLASSRYRLVGKVPANVGIIEGVLRIHWQDEDATTGQTVSHSADWSFANAVPNSNNFELSVATLELYNFLYRTIGVATSTNVIRHIGNVDIIIYTGTTDLLQYQTIVAAQGVGLTANEIKPNYTNIKGKNGVLGLFTSRGTRMEAGHQFTAKTINAFIGSGRLAGLNLKP